MANFYVSPAGDDSHSGSSADPDGAFCTLARAQAAMRASPGADTVHIRAGTYALASPLRLTTADTGSSFVAYDGEQPILSGGTAVTGWQAGADGVWTARLALSDMRQLTVGSIVQTEARFPNYDPADPVRGGWLWADVLPGGHDPTRELAYDKNSLDASRLAPGERVTVFSELGYSCDTLAIASVDTDAGIVRFAERASYPIGPTSRFFVSGGEPQLDQPGEWWFDGASRVLSFKAPAGFDGGAVAAGGDKIFFNIDGATDISVKGLTFSDATATVNAEAPAAIVIARSSGVTVEGNRFTNVAKGVLLDDNAHDNTIATNDFSNIGAAAIDLTPLSHENVVAGNVISRVGTTYHSASAIALTETWGNTVANNRIQDVPRFGISDSHYDDSQKSGGNLIEYNEILHSGQETPDVGAIYVFSHDDAASLGNVIRYNRIVDTGGVNTVTGEFVPGFDYSWGIYLDDFASDTKVYGNFVSGTVLGGVYIHGGHDNEVSNNILLDNKLGGLRAQEVNRVQMLGNTYHDNIVQLPEDQARVVVADPNFISPSSFYDNIYLSPSGVIPEFDNYRTLEQWRALGGDRGSDVVASVGFVDPAAGDYSFSPDSFALSRGLQQLPFGLIGPNRADAATGNQGPASPQSATELGGGADASTFADAMPAAPEQAPDMALGVDQLMLSPMAFDMGGSSVSQGINSPAQQNEPLVQNLIDQAAPLKQLQLAYGNELSTFRSDADGFDGFAGSSAEIYLDTMQPGVGEIYLG